MSWSREYFITEQEKSKQEYITDKEKYLKVT